MGFNIEQYELASAYSNVSGNDALRGAGTVCVKGNPVYGIPLTYAGFQMTKKGREKISENRQICQARYAMKQGTKESSTPVSIDVPKENVLTTTNQIVASSSGADVASSNTDSKKSNTALYIGIGAGVLLLGIVTVVLLTRKK